MSKSEKNLEEAFAGESQANRKYLAFADKADKEGFSQIAKLFRAAAAAETVHAHAHLRALGGQLAAATNEAIVQRRHRLAGEARALQRLSPQAQIDRRRQRVDDLSHTAQTTIAHRLALGRERLNGLSLRLTALNPEATLARGYAVVRRSDDGRVVSRVGQVALGDRLSVQVSDGEFGSVVEEKEYDG